MTEHAADFHRGDMDIHAQQATFKAVMSATKWSCLAVAVGVLFFTLLFCTDAGFGSAFLTAVVLTVIGTFALRSPAPAH
jgi:hypothetical protein